MYVIPRDVLLLGGILVSVFGGALLAEAISRAFRSWRSWRARRANGPVARAARAKPLPRGVRTAKSLRGEPLLERPPLRYYDGMLSVFGGIVGLILGAAGVYFFLGAFGIIGPIVHTPPP